MIVLSVSSTEKILMDMPEEWAKTGIPREVELEDKVFEFASIGDILGTVFYNLLSKELL